MYEDYLSKSLSNIIMARQALCSFKEYKSKDLKNGAAYHAQQAIELILKYLIYNNEKYQDGTQYVKQLRTHNIDMLIKNYAKPYGIYVPRIIEKNAKAYTTWEAESRYDLHFSVRADSVYHAINEAESWLMCIKSIYKKKIIAIRAKYPQE